ncbi:MAG: DMT family transporter [Bdellovibrionota bacterium]
MKNLGPVLALLSAALFGMSPALTKSVLGEMSPILVAGLLYLGSGLGLLLLLVIQKKSVSAELRRLTPPHRLKFLGAILSGGVLAPLCLVYGIQLASAFEVSLLLNLESVTTTLIAFLIFHEHVGKRVWAGKLLLIFGGLIITLQPNSGSGFSIPALLVVAACILWGLDNNLTRDVDDLSPSVLAGIKGLIAGLFNVFLALGLGQGTASKYQIIATLFIGSISYGVSLVLFINALRSIGSSRTASYFATGPFLGMLFSVLLLGEQPLSHQWIAAFFMIIGVWALYKENHAHLHTHTSTTHEHKHLHDEHHQHQHNGTEGPGPHEHAHTHKTLAHTHIHLPDIHHRHRH